MHDKHTFKRGWIIELKLMYSKLLIQLNRAEDLLRQCQLLLIVDPDNTDEIYRMIVEINKCKANLSFYKDAISRALCDRN